MKKFSKAHWTYLVDEIFNTNRVSEQKNLSWNCCPDNKTLITLEKTNNENFDIIKDKKKIISLAMHDMAYFNITKKNISEIFLTELKDAYPIYYKGYQLPVKETITKIAKINNIITTGRQGLFLDIDMHDSMVLGKEGFLHLVSGNTEEFYRNHEKIIEKMKK